MIATICIPVAAHHTEISKAAVSSAYAQTVPAYVRVYTDNEGYGPGHGRNQMLAKVETPFVVFLDADDTLEPDFLETCLKAYKPGRYVYTDWYEDGIPQSAPVCDDDWISGRYRMHLVTCLLPTRVIQAAGGFDPQLPGIEDTELFLRIHTHGYCGLHVQRPLVHYSGYGHRSKTFRAREDKDTWRQEVWRRYEGKTVGCGCNNTPRNENTGGERQDGDVVAEVLYAPMSQVINGRFYPRPMYTGQRMWVARADAIARSDLWKIVDDPESMTPAVDDVIALGLAGLNA